MNYVSFSSYALLKQYHCNTFRKEELKEKKQQYTFTRVLYHFIHEHLQTAQALLIVINWDHIQNNGKNNINAFLSLRINPFYKI
jgi:hypothetical protein